VIIDGDSMLYRAYYKFQNLTNKQGKSTSILFGFPYILRKNIVNFHPEQVIVVFDSGSSSFRREILPTYRVREKKLGFDSESFYSQKLELMLFLKSLRVRVLYYKSFENYEADDIIYAVSRYLKDFKKVVVTSDKDFYQILDDKTNMYNPFNDTLITYENCLHITGFKPEEVVDYLILMGDKADKSPGLPGMGDKRIREFLNRYTRITNFLNSADNYKSIDKNVLHQLYLKNLMLINLHYYYTKYGVKYFRKNIRKELETILPPGLGLASINAYCSQNDIFSFTEDFLRPFKNLR